MEPKTLLDTLSAQGGQQRCGSKSADPALDLNNTHCHRMPADPAAAASSGAGGASAGAPEQSAFQVRDLPLLWYCQLDKP